MKTVGVARSNMIAVDSDVSRRVLGHQCLRKSTGVFGLKWGFEKLNGMITWRHHGVTKSVWKRGFWSNMVDIGDPGNPFPKLTPATSASR